MADSGTATDINAAPIVSDTANNGVPNCSAANSSSSSRQAERDTQNSVPMETLGNSPEFEDANSVEEIGTDDEADEEAGDTEDDSDAKDGKKIEVEINLPYSLCASSVGLRLFAISSHEFTDRLKFNMMHTMQARSLTFWPCQRKCAVICIPTLMDVQ